MARAKAIVTLGYNKYVLDVDKAVQVLEALSGVEKYEDVYHKAEEGGTTHHIYIDTEGSVVLSVHLMTEALYQMAKLAGKPEKK
jgi:hypothetical protein